MLDTEGREPLLVGRRTGLVLTVDEEGVRPLGGGARSRSSPSRRRVRLLPSLIVIFLMLDWLMVKAKADGSSVQ